MGPAPMPSETYLFGRFFRFLRSSSFRAPSPTYDDGSSLVGRQVGDEQNCIEHDLPPHTTTPAYVLHSLSLRCRRPWGSRPARAAGLGLFPPPFLLLVLGFPAPKASFSRTTQLAMVQAERGISVGCNGLETKCKNHVSKSSQKGLPSRARSAAFDAVFAHWGLLILV